MKPKYQSQCHTDFTNDTRVKRTLQQQQKEQKSAGFPPKKEPHETELSKL